MNPTLLNTIAILFLGIASTVTSYTIVDVKSKLHTLEEQLKESNKK